MRAEICFAKARCTGGGSTPFEFEPPFRSDSDVAMRIVFVAVESKMQHSIKRPQWWLLNESGIQERLRNTAQAP
jgi:hypothetical protein